MGCALHARLSVNRPGASAWGVSCTLSGCMHSQACCTLKGARVRCLKHGADATKVAAGMRIVDPSHASHHLIYIDLGLGATSPVAVLQRAQRLQLALKQM